jgi:hypothetical protein
MPANNKFDLDLKFGQQGEEWLKLLADERKIEVKRDRMWAKTGNIFIEYEYKKNPSGLFVTEADYFAYILYKDGVNIAVYIWKTDIIKSVITKWIETKKFKSVNGGDNYATKGLVIPIEALGSIINGG